MNSFILISLPVTMLRGPSFLLLVHELCVCACACMRVLGEWLWVYVGEGVLRLCPSAHFLLRQLVRDHAARALLLRLFLVHEMRVWVSMCVRACACERKRE